MTARIIGRVPKIPAMVGEYSLVEGGTRGRGRQLTVVLSSFQPMIRWACSASLIRLAGDVDSDIVRMPTEEDLAWKHDNATDSDPETLDG